MKNLLYVLIALFTSHFALAQEGNRGGGPSNPFGACVPTSTYSTTDGDYITSFYYEDLSLFAGTGGSAFYNYGSQVANLTLGQTNYFYMTSGSYCCDNIELWIDWDGDNIFSDGEIVYYNESEDSEQFFEIMVTPSTDVYPRMVIGRALVYADVDGDLCGDFEYGQVFDFPVSLNSDPMGFCQPVFNLGGFDGDYLSYWEGPASYYYGGMFSPTYQMMEQYENVTMGQAITLSVTAGTYGDDYYYLWVDEDDSYTFDEDELKASYDAETADEVFSMEFTPDAMSWSGVHRARMACRYSANEDACATAGYGHAVDFYMIYTDNNAGSYCAITSEQGTTDGDYITGFFITDSGIDMYNNYPGPYYQDFTDFGYYYVLSGASGAGQLTSGTYSNDNYRAWIDYNQNNIFETGEQIFSTASTEGGQVLDVSWTHPTFTNQHGTRMRVMSHFDDMLNDPCDIGLFGEVEDYTAILVKNNDGYCDPYLYRGNTDGDYISSFQLNEVTLEGLGDTYTSFYNDYTSSVAQVIPGEMYNMNIQGGNYATDRYKVWADWNNDGVFDDLTETVGIFQTSASFEFFDMPMNVPITAVLGNTRLRLMCVDNETPAPCMTASYGEYLEITLAVVEEIAVNEFSSTNVQLYPNPSTGELTLMLDQSWNAVTATVYDASGRAVESFKAQGVYKWEHNYAPGMYTLRLHTQDGEVLKPFMVR